MSIRSIAVAFVLVTLPVMASAQDSKLSIPSFRHLQNRAVDSVDITIGRWPIRLAAAFVGDDSEEDLVAKEFLKDLRSVRIRSYKFATDNVYSNSDVETVRRQLKEPQWSQLAQIHSSNKHSDVDIYISMEGDEPTGLALVATEPREFTIVNIVGKVDPKNLSRLSKHFHFSTGDLDTEKVDFDKANR